MVVVAGFVPHPTLRGSVGGRCCSHGVGWGEDTNPTVRLHAGNFHACWVRPVAAKTFLSFSADICVGPARRCFFS